MQKIAGAAPFYILKCPWPVTGTIYISDYKVSFTTWQGGITTLPWIDDWGKIIEDLSRLDTLTKVSTFSADIIIEQSAAENIKTILDTPGNNPESCNLELYMAYRDLLGAQETTDPTQKIMRGKIIDLNSQTDLSMHLDMADISVQYAQ